jgi:integrase
VRIAKMYRHSSGQWAVRIKKQAKYLGRDRSKAEGEYRKIIAAHYGAAPPPEGGGGGATVSELLEAFRGDQLEHCPPRWRVKREGKLAMALDPALKLYAKLPARSFGPMCLRTVRGDYAAVPGRTRGYVNELTRKLRSAWKWGVSMELVPLETYLSLKTVPDLKRGEMGLAEGRERVAVDWEHVEATLPFLNDRNRDLVVLLAETAARPDEIVRLRPADVRKHPDGTWSYAPAEHKTARSNKRRLIVFNATCKAILARYLEGRGADDWLFPADPFQAPGQHFCVTSLRNAITSACHRAGVARWTPYALRHYKITEVSLKHGVEVAQALAGHASKATTAIYDHNELARIKRAVG